MKKTIIILLLTLVSSTIWAQDQATKKKIESARIALISERLGLTPDQAEKFWPVYREYLNERNAIRQEFKDERSKVNLEQATEEQKRQLLDLRLQIKEQEVALERQYSERLLQIISTKQILSLRQAEEDFRQMIIDRIRERQAQQAAKQRLRNQREDQLRNRRNN
jgi:hypothetical protein